MVRRSTLGTAYQLFGDSSKPTLVFIHGLGLTMSTWDDYITPLQSDYQLLRYDLSGHGQSSLPQLDDTIDLSHFSTQLLQLLDELSIEQCALIGFSLGGMINRRFAIDYPHRATSLIILNSPHERSPAQQQLVEQRALDTTAGGAITTIDATLERWFSEDFRKHSAPHLELVKSTVLANEPTHYSRCRFVLANGVVELIRPEPAINKPTLVITCENDTGSTPAMSVAIADEIANATILIIPQLQHMGLVEQPKLFIDPIIAFL